MSLIEDFKWRHAVKAFDPNQKISQENIDSIVEAARLAPTSSGLQPFKVFAVSNQAIKDQLVEGSFNPDSMKECSHVLVFAGWNQYTPELIDKMFDRTTDERGLPRGRFSSYTDMLKAAFAEQTPEQHQAHIAKQVYIALGFAMAQAANLRIDTCPAEGFNAEAVDKVLGLGEQNLKSMVLLYIGTADPQRDWLGQMAKVRWAKEDFVVSID